VGIPKTEFPRPAQGSDGDGQSRPVPASRFQQVKPHPRELLNSTFSERLMELRGVDQNEKVKRGKKLKMAPRKSYTEKDSKKEVENSEEDAEEENSKEEEEEEFDAEDCWLRSCLEL
jgi:hypothetical protein